MPKFHARRREVVAGLICSPLYFTLRPACRLALVKCLVDDLQRRAA